MKELNPKLRLLKDLLYQIADNINPETCVNDDNRIDAAIETLTTLNLSFILQNDASIEDYTITVDGQQGTVDWYKPEKEDRYYVRISNIAAKDLDKVFEVVII